MSKTTYLQRLRHVLSDLAKAAERSVRLDNVLTRVGDLQVNREHLNDFVDLAIIHESRAGHVRINFNGTHTMLTFTEDGFAHFRDLDLAIIYSTTPKLQCMEEYFRHASILAPILHTLRDLVPTDGRLHGINMLADIVHEYCDATTVVHEMNSDLSARLVDTQECVYHLEQEMQGLLMQQHDHPADSVPNM